MNRCVNTKHASLQASKSGLGAHQCLSVRPHHMHINATQKEVAHSHLLLCNTQVLQEHLGLLLRCLHVKATTYRIRKLLCSITPPFSKTERKEEADICPHFQCPLCSGTNRVPPKSTLIPSSVAAPPQLSSNGWLGPLVGQEAVAGVGWEGGLWGINALIGFKRFIGCT